jgi:hypothetical protein
MTDTIRAEALVGPWQVVLADRHGNVYADVATALAEVEDQDDPVTISVVRGTAVPERLGGDLFAPGSHHTGDVAYEIEAYLEDPHDSTIGADARLAQAEAMAAGLNAAGGA